MRTNVPGEMQVAFSGWSWEDEGVSGRVLERLRGRGGDGGGGFYQKGAELPWVLQSSESQPSGFVIQEVLI